MMVFKRVGYYVMRSIHLWRLAASLLFIQFLLLLLLSQRCPTSSRINWNPVLRILKIVWQIWFPWCLEWNVLSLVEHMFVCVVNAFIWVFGWNTLSCLVQFVITLDGISSQLWFYFFLWTMDSVRFSSTFFEEAEAWSVTSPDW